MPSIQDDRGYNQGFKRSISLDIRMSRRCDYIIKKLQVFNEADVLEIGCGTGGLSYELALKTGFSVIGSDLCLPFIESAKREYSLSNLQYEVLDFNNPENNKNIALKKYDAIIGNGILHHLYYNLEESLTNIKKLLKPNGIIVFLEPNIFNPYCLLIFKIKYLRILAKLEPTEMAFSKKFIYKKLTKLGFKYIDIKYKDFLIPGIPAFLVSAIILLGAVLEKIPVLKLMTQSIYISAMKE